MIYQRSRKLHHLSVTGVQQHITFRLNDSLPASALKRIEQELVNAPENSRNKVRIQHLHGLLDQGFGSCLLSYDACAEVVVKSLMFGHGQRYKLFAWCVMPNHVHVLLEQVEGWSLDRVVQGWKRFTSRAIVKLGHETALADMKGDGPSFGIWQRGYWDRYVRSRGHLVKVKWYIEQNPVKAGFVERPEAWRWSSVGWGMGAGAG